MKIIRSIQKILFWTALLSLTSCEFGEKKNTQAWGALPEVTSLDNLKQTDFVITLENPISENKNSIYAPAFLYAWDKIKDELKFPIIADNKNSIDFNLLNKSVSHKNSLTDKEYTVISEVTDGTIMVKAFFNKTLPFETKLQVSEKPIIFNKTKVSAFGMYSYNSDVAKATQILYYKDDNNFILKLVPKDKQHKIILVKGLDKYQTLKDAINLTNELIALGEKEQADGKLSWKYQITQEDIFSIPSIKFNIETNYKNIEGQYFKAGENRRHSVITAYQRTGFILNENGAVVESEAIIAVDSAVAKPIIKYPKKMIFDRPFLIIIKRGDKINPYFVMNVANSELLTRK